MSFKSITKVGTSVPVPPTTQGIALGISLHGSGGNEGIFGDIYDAVCDRSLGYKDDMVQRYRVRGEGTSINRKAILVPRDYILRDDGREVQTFWTGYTEVINGVEVEVPYTHRRLAAMIEAVYQSYPQIDRLRGINMTGNSMGACGSILWGFRNPQLIHSMFVTVPRWKAFEVYALYPGWGVLKPGIKLDSGEDFVAWADMVAYTSDPTHKVPFIGWASGRLDASMPWQQQVDAVAALRATKRGFVFAWNNGNHSEGGKPMVNINASYDQLGMFSLLFGYPILMNSSLDSPLTALEGGINLGFKWRNVVDSINEFSCEIANTLGEVTVDVMPHGRAFTGELTQHVTIPVGQWLKLLWKQDGTEGTTGTTPDTGTGDPALLAQIAALQAKITVAKAAVSGVLDALA